MIIPLKESNYTIAWDLFQDTFDNAEATKFKQIWKQRDRSFSLGCWDNSYLVGIAIVNNHQLQYIYVNETQRGKGLGSKLLQAVLDVCPTIHLTPVDNPKIHDWYVKHGFKLSKIQGSTRLYVHHDHNLRK